MNTKVCMIHDGVGHPRRLATHEVRGNMNDGHAVYFCRKCATGLGTNTELLPHIRRLPSRLRRAS